MESEMSHFAIEQLKGFFVYKHLPPHLQAISKPFADLVEQLDERLPDSPEKTVAFRKLLEGKDAAVRAALSPPK
jgi:hypothetical protein